MTTYSVYVGQSSVRTIRAADWTTLGIANTGDTVWLASNGWGIDEANLSAGQIAYLATQSDFLVNQAATRGTPGAVASDVATLLVANGEPGSANEDDVLLDKSVGLLKLRTGGKFQDVLRDPLRAIGRILTGGHSLDAEGGASGISRGWTNLLAGYADAEVMHYGRGGAVLAFLETAVTPYGSQWDGGVGHVLNRVPYRWMGGTRNYSGTWANGTTYKILDVVFKGADLDHLTWYVSLVDANVGHDPAADDGTHWQAIQPLAGQTKPYGSTYHPEGRLPIWWFGNNDLGAHKDLPTFLEAFRALLAFSNGAEISIAAYDGRVQFNGAGWTAAQTLAAGSGVCGGWTNGSRALAANTVDAMDVMTQPDYPGGFVTLTYVAMGRITSGVLVASVDGVPTTTKNFATTPIGFQHAISGFGPRGTQITMRVPVTAGQHHIQIKQTTAYAGVSDSFVGIFTDALIIEASPAGPGVVMGFSKFIDAAKMTSFYPLTTPTEADVDTWDAALKAMVAAEFPNLLYWEPTSLQAHDPKVYYVDGVHPNDHGQDLIADGLVTALVPYLGTFTKESLVKLGRAKAVGQALVSTFNDNSTNTITAPAGAFTYPSWTSNLASGGTRYIEGTIRAEPGDVIEILFNAMWNNENDVGNLDFASLSFAAGPSGAVSVGSNGQIASGGASNGLPGCLGQANQYGPISAAVFYTVGNNEGWHGQIVIRAMFKSGAGLKKLLLGASNPVTLSLRNIGQRQVTFGELTAR